MARMALTAARWYFCARRRKKKTKRKLTTQHIIELRRFCVYEILIKLLLYTTRAWYYFSARGLRFRWCKPLWPVGGRTQLRQKSARTGQIGKTRRVGIDRGFRFRARPRDSDYGFGSLSHLLTHSLRLGIIIRELDLRHFRISIVADERRYHDVVDVFLI